MKGIILEMVSKENNLFISDLRGAGVEPSVLKSLQNIEWRLFDISGCNYTLSYIFNQQLSFTDYDKVYDFINSFH
ncbi:hypothetical protein [Hydrogenoanaerobacterium sp.]|uniref:hypothetical protein n=1 Tax=Hydrogenoanaerobacterium sp. TaxID=2953763 RepID=UPI0028A085F5|nr:hypothetical protein [Hydrogenoanaerobacterium sp.]